jgi:asparagine synthase (glutamine-hydrolysing)
LQFWTAIYRRHEANEAAAHGLDLSRPLADKRVVEFGLAIPEDLYVRNGRNRYLACRALADIYPPEFQVREHSRDMLEPDYAGLLEASQPMLEAEIARMAAKPSLRKYFDFDEMAAALREPHVGTRLGPASRFALRAFCAARYAAWFEQSNAGGVGPDSRSTKKQV